jgi:DNA-binding protein H-NS
MLNDKVEKLQVVVQLQQKQIGTLTAQLKEQAAQIQKVSAELEMVKPAPRVVENR